MTAAPEETEPPEASTSHDDCDVSCSLECPRMAELAQMARGAVDVACSTVNEPAEDGAA